MSNASNNSIFSIKNSNLACFEFILTSNKIEEISLAIANKYPNANFFEQQAIIINTTAIDKEDTKINWDLAHLVSLLRQINLVPTAVISNSPLICAQAKKFNFPIINQEQVKTKTTIKPQAEQLASIIVDKPIRSGQKIYAKGCDLIVLAMVSKGAEIIADGNIHVYAPLRGRAMAGASGNVNSNIFVKQLEAELISIAGVYCTSEASILTKFDKQSARIKLEQNKLIFEAI